MEKFLYKFRLLPMMMIVASLAFMVRAGDFVHGLKQMGAAQAQEEVAATPPPMQAERTATNNAPTEIEGRLDLNSTEGDVQLRPEFQEQPRVAQGENIIPPVEGSTPAISEVSEAVNWKDSGDTDIEDSAVKTDLYKDLAKRRDLLDKKEKEIGVREALLSAAERELDQKLREMTTLRTEIESLMKKRTAEEDAKIASLVKIYEGMKPKDAASILNTLDLDVLLVIMTKMSERKSSPIMAEMNPDRARTLTLMMAEQRQKPELPELH